MNPFIFRCKCCKRVFIYATGSRLPFTVWLDSLEDHVEQCVDAMIKKVEKAMKWTDVNNELMER